MVKSSTRLSNYYLRFKGSVGYTLNFNTIDLKFDKIEHNWEVTPEIQIYLWAVANYTGGYPFVGGTRMGEYRLKPIKKGYCYQNRTYTVPRTSPDPGHYTLIMTLGAHCSGKYINYDYNVFHSIDIWHKVKLTSPSYSRRGDSVSLCAQRISHNFNTDTGKLNLVLWACNQPALEDAWNGQRVAESELGRLEKGGVYSDVVRTVPLVKLPIGTYYMVMELESWEGEGWMSRDHQQMSGVLVVR